MAMTSNQKTAASYFGATILVCLASAAYILSVGISAESIDLALRMSGRIAFLILVVVFAARPLQQLLKAPWTAKLLRNRKLLGVAFAGIHTAHFGLILMRHNHVDDFQFEYNHFGLIIYGTIFLMLITSFSGPARAVGQKTWKVIHKLGIFVLFAGFTITQLPQADDPIVTVNNALLVLAAAALLARIAAFLKTRKS